MTPATNPRKKTTAAKDSSTKPANTPPLAQGYRRLPAHDHSVFTQIIESASIHDLLRLRDEISHEIHLSLECIADGEEKDDRQKDRRKKVRA